MVKWVGVGNGTVRLSLVWFGKTLVVRGAVRLGTVRFGGFRLGEVWWGRVRYGKTLIYERRGMARCGKARRDCYGFRYDTLRFGMATPSFVTGMVGFGLIWLGGVRQGMIGRGKIIFGKEI